MFRVGVAVVGVGLATVLFASAGSAAPRPTVPVSFVKLVTVKARGLAYAPTRLPAHYRYRSYWLNGAQQRLTVRFADRRYPPDRKRTLEFTVERFGGPLATCGRGREKTLQMDGNKVYWGNGVAWRCVRTSARGRVLLQATGFGLPDVALASVVASGKRLGAAAEKRSHAASVSTE